MQKLRPFSLTPPVLPKSSSTAPKVTVIVRATPSAPKAPSASPRRGAQVTSSKGSPKRNPKGRARYREDHERQRGSNTFMQQRIRKLLEGTLSPQEALSAMFMTPSLMLVTHHLDWLVETPDLLRQQSNPNLLNLDGFLVAG